MDSEALSLKEKDICYDRLIMEEDISPMDEVPKVELTIEAERGMKSNTAEENGTRSIFVCTYFSYRRSNAYVN